MGCPTTYDGKVASWVKGKLSTLSKGSKTTGLESYGFAYNAYGQRVSKSYSYLPGTGGLEGIYVDLLLNSNKQFYYDHSGRLIAEVTARTYQSTGAQSERVVFLYDGNTVIGMQHTVNGVTTPYYFHRNPLGDVVGIYDTNSNLVAKYTYDAWGNCTISGNTTVAKANPIRYRGYYYDEDTGLYYCNARYYSPTWRRFISPDDTAYLDPSSVNGLNQYCYCGNDPVNYADPSGCAWETIFDVLSLCASIVEVAFNPADPFAWMGLAGDAIDLIPFVTGVGETIRALKAGDRIIESADGAIDTYRRLKKANVGLDLEIHHIIEKRFAKNFGYGKRGGSMLSIALSTADHRVFTNKWRMALEYGVKHSDKEVLEAAIEIYGKNHELLAAAIYTIVAKRL